MKRISILILVLTGLFLSKNAAAAITGTLGACVGGTTTLIGDSASTSAGTWSSGTPSVATIGVSTGLVTALSTGTTIITFTGTTGTATAIFTVSIAPGAISGGTSPFCVGASVTLTNPTPGGTWSGGWGTTVGAATGLVTGISVGFIPIYYTMGPGCSVYRTVTVVGTPAIDSVYGPPPICPGNTAILTCSTAGGTYTSSNTSVATVGLSSGVVTAVSVGTAVISYVLTGACGTSLRTNIVTVVSSITAGTITGTPSVGVSFTTPLANSAGGGTWSSGSPSIATISASGVVTGVTVGTAVITYTKTGCSGPVYATTTITVTAANCISGDVLFTSGGYFGYVKVWLIKYNPATLMLTASDSTIVHTTAGTTAHYTFCGMSTDSFRVKAEAIDTIMGPSTGYQPTYHTSSAFWHSATVVYHVSGTHDINKNITMGYGAVTAGPGFIAGDVTTGANKGTTDGLPAVGLLIYCVNNATGAVIQQAYTNAAGHYSFSNLPLGVPYKISPELINYTTIPYPPVTLTGGAPSMVAANFGQHTISLTIIPIAAVVNDITAATSFVSIVANPVRDVMNLEWNVAHAGGGTLTIVDITGRTVLTKTIPMNAGYGNAAINVNGIGKGLHVVHLTADGINYKAKIELQ